jgi:hypothetical protein
MFEKLVRFFLLALSAITAWSFASGGVILLFTAMVFCDHGTMAHCVSIGSKFFDFGAGVAVVASMGIFALVFEGRRLGWYLVCYPIVLLGLAVFTAHLPIGLRESWMPALFGVMAVLALVYWFVSRQRRARET